MDSNLPARGAEVSGAETLLRAITPKAASTWFPGGVPSSAIFSHPVFSVDVESLTTLVEMLGRWPPGSGIISFNSREARALGFDARLEPEFANDAHANVYMRPTAQSAETLGSRTGRDMSGAYKTVLITSNLH